MQTIHQGPVGFKEYTQASSENVLMMMFEDLDVEDVLCETKKNTRRKSWIVFQLILNIFVNIACPRVFRQWFCFCQWLFHLMNYNDVGLWLE